MCATKTICDTFSGNFRGYYLDGVQMNNRKHGGTWRVRDYKKKTALRHTITAEHGVGSFARDMVIAESRSDFK